MDPLAINPLYQIHSLRISLNRSRKPAAQQEAPLNRVQWLQRSKADPITSYGQGQARYFHQILQGLARNTAPSLDVLITYELLSGRTGTWYLLEPASVCGKQDQKHGSPIGSSINSIVDVLNTVQAN